MMLEFSGTDKQKHAEGARLLVAKRTEREALGEQMCPYLVGSHHHKAKMSYLLLRTTLKCLASHQKTKWDHFTSCLEDEVVESLTLEEFKAGLDMALSTWSGRRCPCPC